MQIAIKVVVALIALLLLVMGFNLMFDPADSALGFNVTPIGIRRNSDFCWIETDNGFMML